MNVEFHVILLLAATGAAVLVGWFLRRGSRAPMLAAAVVTGITVWVCGYLLSQPTDTARDAWGSVELAQLRPLRPVQEPGAGYVASTKCVDCHPRKHATWAASYHRRMTQVASPDAVIGDFEDREVQALGRTYRLRRQNDVCWVEMDDPEAAVGEAPRIDAPLVMTTGYHHMQVYWYPTGDTKILGQMPLVYLRETEQWVPRDAAFLQAPMHFGAETGRWNKTCIECHTTHGQPRPLPSGGWDSRAAEFGIACEACHGPGEEHAALRVAGGQPANDPIVNPSSLTHRRSTEVCGQCHSINTPRDTPSHIAAQAQGKSYRPGDRLDDSRWLVRDDAETRAHLQKYIGEETDQYLVDQFWADGMVRISGREYNGLVESACFQEGAMSCLSCHLMHPDESDPRPLAEWANDQLGPELRTNAACVDCHDATEYGSQHTHHAANSSGSLCYNCHMPHTTYGLLKAIRSHEISIPSVLNDDVQTGRPNACNLCHLDRTVEWTAEQMQAWYGTEVPALKEEQRDYAAAALLLLKGDAGQRALAAWSMGWSSAHEISGQDWQAPLLAQLLEDPYDAVRFVARRSLRSLPGYEDFEYDYVASPTERAAARQRALQQWPGSSSERERPTQLLLTDRFEMDDVAIRKLLQQRDDRPMNLAE